MAGEATVWTDIGRSLRVKGTGWFWNAVRNVKSSRTGRKPPHAPYSPMGQSHMLGSTRSTVTLAAGRLKEEKLITYKRAEIAIVDRKGLEKRACECYGIIKQHLDDFAAFDTDDTK